MDVYSRLYRDYWAGERPEYSVERDDGLRQDGLQVAGYFDVPRSEAEVEMLGRLEGPVLDLGAGPGSYTLYLQERGLDVTAIDVSPGAIEVCRARGCRDARAMDLRRLELEPE